MAERKKIHIARCAFEWNRVTTRAWKVSSFRRHLLGSSLIKLDLIPALQIANFMKIIYQNIKRTPRPLDERSAWHLDETKWKSFYVAMGRELRTKGDACANLIAHRHHRHRRRRRRRCMHWNRFHFHYFRLWLWFTFPSRINHIFNSPMNNCHTFFFLSFLFRLAVCVPSERLCAVNR